MCVYVKIFLFFEVESGLDSDDSILAVMEDLLNFPGILEVH